jgi:predicted glycoside hydrolase/deacetylase ChbG (UPF0249 family)
VAFDLKFCADDWGMSPGINDGIISLARAGVLYSVSLMANAKYLNYKLSELIELQSTGLKFNLHFNLTHESNTKDVISLCENYFLGHIEKDEIKKKFNQQIQILIDHNVQLSGIDGHHHVHMIPFVFKAICPEMKKYNIQELRTMEDYSHIGSYLTSLISKTMFEQDIKNLNLIKCGYLLTNNLNNKSLTKKREKFNYLIIHPAKFDDFDEVGLRDDLREQRVLEYNYLMEQVVGKI